MYYLTTDRGVDLLSVWKQMHPVVEKKEFVSTVHRLHFSGAASPPAAVTSCWLAVVLKNYLKKKKNSSKLTGSNKKKIQNSAWLEVNTKNTS